MNTELFIARRILQGENNKNRLSRPIVIISLTSIILGLAIMLVTVSVVTGFQQGVRDKVIGFGSHIQVTKLNANNSMESAPMLIDQDFYPSIEDEEENVRKIQPYAYKPGIIQHKRDSIVFEVNGSDSLTSSVDLKGMLFKGVDKNYDWSFFDDKLVEGRLIDFDGENDEVLISSYIRDKMGYKVGDELHAFFIQERPTPRKFTIVGIYRSGFEQFDQKFIYTQMHHIQKLNNWGVQTFLTVADTCIQDHFVLEARTKGGTKAYRYDWGNGFGDAPYYLISGGQSSDVQVISTDFDLEVYGVKKEPNSVPDTAYASIQVDSACSCNEETRKQIVYSSTDLIDMPFGSIQIKNGEGTSKLYTGGFEIMLTDWDDLEKMDEIIYNNIPFDMETTKIDELHPNIFAWLEILDINVVVIISLILIVSLMNMVTSLLVMILEKTNMIGIMKAMGAYNSSIRRIFLYHSMFLLSRGLLWGNVLGIGLILIQYYFEPISLNPDVYYLDKAAVSLNIWHFLLINILTVVICRIVLIIPSFLVSRIRPTRAIKFD